MVEYHPHVELNSNTRDIGIWRKAIHIFAAPNFHRKETEVKVRKGLFLIQLFSFACS